MKNYDPTKPYSNEETVKHLASKGLTVGFAESCTGGRLSADLTTVSGSSDVVRGSLVCYQIEAKRRILGLTHVNEKNVVSDKTAKGMVDAARKKFETDITIATTGYIEPGSTLGEGLLGGPATGPHAYWAIIRPVIGDTSGHMHWDSWRIDFDANQTREENREFLLSEVFRHLHQLAEKL